MDFCTITKLSVILFCLLPTSTLSWSAITNTLPTKAKKTSFRHQFGVFGPLSFPQMQQTEKVSFRRSMILFSNSDGKEDEDHKMSQGIYRIFAEHAWNALETRKIANTNRKINEALVPSDLAQNSAPAKGPGEFNVKIQVEAADSESLSPSALRLVRFALLETVPSSSIPNDAESKVSTSGIHVLNFVMFPKTHVKDVPIFGADLVTLPGNKHLIVIDFQPFLTINSSKADDDSCQKGKLTLPDSKLLKRLQNLHQKHVLDNVDELPWGGDIPPNAKRFFSSYALWTRLGEKENALEMVQTKVFDAFVDYLDLYIDILNAAAAKQDEGVANGEQETKELKEGHLSYLNYRRTNDPARPMLKR